MSAIAAAPTPQRLAYDPMGGARALLVVPIAADVLEAV